MQALAARRQQVHRHHPRVEHFNRLDPGRQLLRLYVLRAGHAGLDHHIVYCSTGAQQEHTTVLFGLGQHIVMRMNLLDFAR